MRLKHPLLHRLLVLLAATALPALSHAIDSTSFEIGTGNKTKMVRLGLQSDWSNRWYASNGTHLGGYWDFTVAGWRGNKQGNISGNTQNIADIGITPVFRFQQDSKTGFYAEAGIGVHLLSELYDNNGRKLSTSFQFGDHIGVGYVFNNKIDLGLRLQHFSNGSIKQPNNGVNFAVLRGSYRF